MDEGFAYTNLYPFGHDDQFSGIVEEPDWEMFSD